MAYDQRWSAVLGAIVLGTVWVYLYETFPHRGVVDQLSIPVPHQTTTSNIPPNLWAELTSVEATALLSWLHQTNSLNLSKSLSGDGSAAVAVVEALWPNKSSVLPYLDTHGPKPEKYARVAIIDTSSALAEISDYAVGPLPPSNATTITPIIYNSGRNFVRTHISDISPYLAWVFGICEEISDITEDLLGAKVNPSNPFDPESLSVSSRPALVEPERIVHWLEFIKPSLVNGGTTLLPQGLYLKVETSSGGPSSWKTLDWYYNGILYPNLTAFRSAWSSSGFVKTQINRDGDWTQIEDWNSELTGRGALPPLSIQPYGPRYQLDRSRSHVHWTGFSFYIATHPFTAVSLFDIRFDDQRIIYELGLQEAMAHYAGSEPIQSGLEFLDTFFGFGQRMSSLVPGHDCPGYAEYIDMHYHGAETTFRNKNAICIFEFTDNAPMQRHTTEFATTVSRNTYLIVRSVSTIGNYDYTIDYIFYLDGSVEVKVRASGFIFAAFLTESLTSSNSSDYISSDNEEFGYRIHPAVQTSMHDHVLNFKADLDICGTSNSLIKTSIEPLTHSYAWDAPEVPLRQTMHLRHETLTQETLLNWPSNSAAMYLIQSNTTNAWGSHRAYRIQPGTGMGTPSHLTILNSSTLGRSAAWSAADLWVLQQHDVEPMSAHHMNFITPLDPLIDFAPMVDEEDIVEQDLVVYFNLGGHHVAHSGDLPNTLMHTSASSVMFSPFNYFDADISKRSRQGVRIERSPYDTKSEARYFGARYEDDVEVGREALEPDLSAFMDGESETWNAIKNRVGAGMLGLFGPR